MTLTFQAYIRVDAFREREIREGVWLGFGVGKVFIWVDSRASLDFSLDTNNNRATLLLRQGPPSLWITTYLIKNGRQW